MDQDCLSTVRTTQYYIAQLNSMEIKIKELNAQLHAKDFEIDYLTSNYPQNKSSSLYKALELKLSIALKENESLKKSFQDQDEVLMIKNQLDQALHMKEVYEQKYRDLKTQSMLAMKFEQVLQEKDNKIQNLIIELNLEKNARLEAEEKLKNSRKENQEKRIKTLESKNIRPNSVKLGRKQSPDVKVSKSFLRQNFSFQSPKLGATEIRPKVVSVSIENNILRAY